MAESICFIAAADPHAEIVHDGKERMADFLTTARDENADFIIHLGDLTYPSDRSVSNCPIDKMPENVYAAHLMSGKCDSEDVIKSFNEFPAPSLHVMGNHEFDFSSEESIKKLYGIDATYYSRHIKGWHIIVLDCNYYRNENGELCHYNRGDYFLTRDLPYLPKEQLSWLAKELKSNDEPKIIFSHQPLFEIGGGLKNFAEVSDIITNARTEGADIRACISGHLHLDFLKEIGGIYYLGINSMSNMWVGKRLEYVGRFSKEIEEENPSLRYVIPYKSAVYVTLKADGDGISVIGRSSKYIQPGPRKLGYKRPISAGMKSRYLPKK